MLVILLPEQVAEHWSEVKWYIEAALPVHKQKGYDMSRVFMNILGGVLIVAVLTDDNGVVIGVFTMTILRDTVTGVKTLEIMTGYAVRVPSVGEGNKMMETIRGLAKLKGCSRITFYTDIQEPIAALMQVGAEKHTYLTWEV